jgi:exonuclease III
MKNQKIKKIKKSKKMAKHKRSIRNKLNIGTWNVRTLHQDFKIDNLLLEMTRLKINILGVAETHWTTEISEAFEQNNYVIIHSDRRDNIHRQGVSIIIDKVTADCLTDYKLISERMMSVTLDIGDGPLTIFQVYAPDTSYSDVEIDLFYENFQDQISQLARKSRYMILGDFNAKVGRKAYENWPEVAGKYSIGKGNDSGEKLLQFSAINSLAIMNTVYKHKHKKLVTWISPDGRIRNQIDYIIMQQKHKRHMKNCRVYNSADIGSDHALLMSTCVFKIPKRTSATALAPKFDTEKLGDPYVMDLFKVRIGGAFEQLLHVDTSVDNLYESFKSTTNSVSKEILGHKKRKQVNGMTVDLCNLCEKRRTARLKYILITRNHSIYSKNIVTLIR